MRKILKISQLFGWTTYIDSEQLANITCEPFSVYLAYLQALLKVTGPLWTISQSWILEYVLFSPSVSLMLQLYFTFVTTDWKNIMQSMWKKKSKIYKTLLDHPSIHPSNLPVLNARFISPSISSFLNPLSHHASGHAPQEKLSYHFWCFRICSLECHSYFCLHETPFHSRVSGEPWGTW